MNTTETRPVIDQANTLHLIRLEAESLSNQLCFIREALAGASGAGAKGPQLYTCAIRGLRDMLATMEDRACGISGYARNLLGIPEGVEIEER